MLLLCACCGLPAAANDAEHWAYAPIARPSVPAPASGQPATSDVDQFLHVPLAEAGIAAGPPADAATRLRRLTFDLAGRPPTLAEQEKWLADPTDAAWRLVVDRLLASPEFGERWAQHWLDVARYAESSGGGRSKMFPDAWRYRDYVIEAFNSDLPFNRFIVEQIAGDLLPAADDAQRDRQAIATGFLTLGAYNYELQDKQLLEMEIVDEQIDVIGRAFLGMSLGCARCHDHKFDPVSTEEYYGLAGIFTSTKSVIHENVGRPMKLPLKHGAKAEHYREHQRLLGKLESERRKLTAKAKSSEQPPEVVVSRLEKLEEEIAQLRADAPRRPEAMGVVDHEAPGDTHVRYGGDVHHRGPLTPRTFIAAAGLPPQLASPKGLPVIAEGTSGRLELARWIASPANRLTARVIVNRVWHHLFGRGIVATPDDFGQTGDPPSHPQLLDHLATTFIDSQWSIKSLVRRLVLTEAYARSSDATAAQVAADPANLWLARARRRQLDAEAIRNAMLYVSGQLDSRRGGRTIHTLATYDTGYEFRTRQRSIYVPRFRNTTPDILAAFGGANANMVTGARSPSILPTQALFLLNGETVVKFSTAAAERLIETDEGDAGRVETLYRSAVGRPPNAEEQELAARYLAAMQQGEQRAAGDLELQAWSGLCQLVFGSIDFRFLH